MRTKNLNLKKKLAFIASVAMIASTAAYLPADFAKDIGVGIVASAEGDEYDASQADIDTFTAYLKVNNRYIGAGDGKLYNTIAAAKAEGANTEAGVVTIGKEVEQVVNQQGVVTTPGKPGFKLSTIGNDGKYAGGILKGKTPDTFDEQWGVSTQAIELPASVTPGSEVQIEIVPDEDSNSAIVSGPTVITATLDEHGKATVATNTTSVEIADENVTVNATTKERNGGNYEVIDFSGMKFQVAQSVDEEGAIVGSSGVKVGEQPFSVVDEGDTTEDSKAYEYAVVKSGNVYATNATVTLGTAVNPGASVTVSLNKKQNWTITGSGVKTDGTISLTMGNDGTASSNLITVTGPNGQKAYYIFTVKNATPVITEGNYSFTNIAGDPIEEVTLATTDFSGKAFKIKKETAVKAVSNGTTTSNKFITVYTVENNIEETTPQTFTFTNNSGFAFADEDSAAIDDTTHNKTKDGVTLTATQADDTFEYKTMTITTNNGDGGNFTTPIMKEGTGDNAKYYQIVFTNEYTINLNDNNDKTLKDGTTTVVGKTVTKPATPEKSGYIFKSWKLDDTENIVWSASGTTQNHKTNITPNVTLKAEWQAYNYYVELDANGGNFGDDVATGYEVISRDDKQNILKAKVQSSASAEERLISQGKAVDSLTNNNLFTKPERDGYEFAGWAVSTSATTALTNDTYTELRPTAENGTVKLVALWKAAENDVEFSSIKVWTGKTTTNADDLTAADCVLEATNLENAVDENGTALSTVKVETGEAYGTLPTPVRKGYTFDGWYKVENKGTAAAPKYSLTKVTSASTLSFEDLDVDGTEDKITLYAKFTENSYTVDYDLDGGEWSKGQLEAAPDKYTVTTIEEKAADIASPIKGTGTFYEFDYWKIEGKTGKYVVNGNTTEASNVSATNLANYLKNNPGNVKLVAVYKTTGTQGNGSYALNLGEDAEVFIYNKTKKTYQNLPRDGAKYSIDGSANTTVGEKFSNNLITETGVGASTYAIVRPGYTFNGWYADKDCTEAFDFSTAKYPDNAEVQIYAGWTADPTTSYQLHYLLVDEEGEIITEEHLSSSIDANTKFYVGSTGSEVSAKDKSITYNGKKYVFDEVLSKGKETDGVIEAEFDYTDVLLNPVPEYDEDNPNNGWDNTGKLSTEGITEIYGVYRIESAAEKPLGTATNVKADNGTVTFTAAANAHHYRVQKTWTVNGVEKTAVGAKFTTTTGTYNVPTGDYKIAIIAYSDDAESASTKYTISAAVEVKGAAVTLGKATNLNVKDGTVTFTAAAGADHYRVQKTYTVNGTTKTAKGSKFTTTTGTFGVPEGDYKIAIIAYADAAETQFTVSDAKEVKAATIDLEAVDTASITVNRGTGEVSWTASKGAKEYVVFKIVKENGKSKIYGGKRTSDTTYKFANFPTDDFKVYIASIDANENKVYSATKKISTLPSATNVKVSDDYKTVSWTKATGDKADKIVKYQVAKFDSTTNKYSYGTKVDASQSSFTLGVKAKVGQQIFVIAFDADGNSSYSDAITVK